jgi:hypothetical protein
MLIIIRNQIIINKVTQLLFDVQKWNGTGPALVEHIQNALLYLADTGGQESAHISVKLSEVISIIENNKQSHGLTGIGKGMQKFDSYFKRATLLYLGRSLLRVKLTRIVNS